MGPFEGPLIKKMKFLTAPRNEGSSEGAYIEPFENPLFLKSFKKSSLYKGPYENVPYILKTI